MGKRTRVLTVVVMALVLVAAFATVANAQASRTRIAWLIADRLDVLGDATVGDDLTVTDDSTLTDDVSIGGDLSVTGTSTLDDIAQTINSVENLGTLPTVASASVAYTTTTGLFTIGDGEVWIVHGVLVNVTTNYDCTGDDCTFQIGDGNDANGLVDLVDDEIQAADTEGTGFAAGWQGQLSATSGAYMAGTNGGFVYAPSGAAETIDFAMGGTDPAGGAATVYILYTRIE
jgi:hypothetical protein